MNVRRLALPAYLVAISLTAIPVFDALMQTAPFHPLSAEWRFAAIGLLSNAIMLPAIGMLIAVAVAQGNEDDVSQRGLRLIGWSAVVIIMVAAASFVLDALQTRTLVRPELQSSFLVASGTAVFKLLFGALTFAALARACQLPRGRKPRRGDMVRSSEAKPSAIAESAPASDARTTGNAPG